MKALAAALELQEDKEIPEHAVVVYAQTMANVLPELVAALLAALPVLSGMNWSKPSGNPADLARAALERAGAVIPKYGHADEDAQ